MDVPDKPTSNSSPGPSSVSATGESVPDDLSAAANRRTDTPEAIVTEARQPHPPNDSALPADQPNCARTRFVYGTTRRNLVRAVKRSPVVPHCREVADAFAEHRKAFQVDILDKFSGACADTNDPWEKIRLIMAEDLSKIWFGTLDVVNAARKIAAGQYPDRRDAADRLDQRLLLVDKFAKLYAVGRRR